jgi:hypothetical protein
MASWRCCCTSAVVAAVLAAAASTTAQAQDPRINEVRIGHLGDDTEEYFELVGTPDSSLDGMTYIVLGDDEFDTFNSGVVEEWVILTPHMMGADGYYLVVENFFSLPGIPDLYLPTLNFEGGYRTHMLVMNFTGQVGDDLDVDDDGVLDAFPWDSIIDCVAVVGPGVPGVDGDHVYCATQVGPDGEFVPGHIYLCEPDLTWTVGDFDVFGPGATDTPGTLNTSCGFVAPCGSGLAGDCFVANGTPNCEDEECCNNVINNWDASCADNWDQTCADLAQIVCRACGDPGAGDCFDANGTAYCDNLDCCNTVCALDPTCCQLNGWDVACADLALANCPLASVEGGDVIVGLSNFDPAVTLALARGDRVEAGGVLIEDSWSQPYMQSMELDNLGGVSHNPAGNLLSLNFGTTVDGGEVYSLAACEAIGPGELIGNTTGLGGAGITLSRLGGLSVSPDNTKIALTGYDTGKVIVYDYTAGNCLGVGAALSNGRETIDAPVCQFDTQGTAWLDNDTVLAFGSASGNIVAIDATTMSTATLATLGAGCAVTDLEYNPTVSPYAFAMHGDFSGTTTNTMWVLDPDNAWGIVNQVDYSLSINTTREICLDSAGHLFVAQFGGNVDLILDAAANASTLADNDSLDWFNTEAEVGFASFPGLDVAGGGGGPEPCPWDCQPTPDGEVNISDFLAILAQWGGPGSCDFDGNNVVDVQDFLEFLGNFGPCP